MSASDHTGAGGPMRLFGCKHSEDENEERCPYCSEPIPEGAADCKMCGAAIKPTPPGSAQRGRRGAARIVLRDMPVRRASSLIETPRTKCSRRNSAHRSTSSTPHLPVSIDHDHARLISPADAPAARPQGVPTHSSVPSVNT